MAILVLALTGIDILNIDWAVGLASGLTMLVFALVGFGGMRLARFWARDG